MNRKDTTPLIRDMQRVKTVTIPVTPITYCQACRRDFDSPELVWYAPIDNTIVCSECAQIHRDRELRIFVKEE